MHRLIGGRSQTEQRVALAADATGKLKALLHQGFSVKPPHSVCDEAFTLSGRSLYESESYDIVQHTLDLDLLANTFMRAPGEAVGTFAIESAMDELAHDLGIDPIALRLRNIGDTDPVSGAPHSQSDLTLAYELGAKKFGWDRRAATPKSRQDGEWLIGMGCATGSFPYVRMPGQCRRGSRSTAMATPRCRVPRMRWAWALRRCSDSMLRIVSVCRSITSPCGSATPICLSAALRAAHRRQLRSALRSTRPA
jgi:xanthine dehydrogenase YagR molybdenum-binding subunit